MTRIVPFGRAGSRVAVAAHVPAGDVAPDEAAVGRRRPVRRPRTSAGRSRRRRSRPASRSRRPPVMTGAPAGLEAYSCTPPAAQRAGGVAGAGLADQVDLHPGARSWCPARRPRRSGGRRRRTSPAGRGRTRSWTRRRGRSRRRSSASPRSGHRTGPTGRWPGCSARSGRPRWPGRSRPGPACLTARAGAGRPVQQRRPGVGGPDPGVHREGVRRAGRQPGDGHRSCRRPPWSPRRGARAPRSRPRRTTWAVLQSRCSRTRWSRWPPGPRPGPGSVGSTALVVDDHRAGVVHRGQLVDHVRRAGTAGRR